MAPLETAYSISEKCTPEGVNVIFDPSYPAIKPNSNSCGDTTSMSTPFSRIKRKIDKFVFALTAYLIVKSIPSKAPLKTEIFSLILSASYT